MKGRKLLIPIATFVLALSMGLAACGNSGDPSQGGQSQDSGQTSAKQEKISVEAEGGKKSLILGEKVQLTAKVGDAVLEGVTWESAKPEIASVDANGLVTSVSKGSAAIKAIKDGYKDGSINISVDYETIKVSVAEGGKTSLLVGETVQLNADKEGVTWASSDAAIAEVSNTGLVTAKKVGSTTITASGNNLNSGSQAINVVRPDPTAVLHFEQAAHFSADGRWYNNNRGPDTTPVYEKSSASDGTCIGYFGDGDKETLTFTSDKAVKAELVITMGHNSSFESLATIFEAKFNTAAIDLANVAYISDSDGQGGYTFQGVSFGEFDLIAGENVLEIGMKGNAPYLDDLQIYAAEAATITVVPAPEMQEIAIAEKSLVVEEGSTVQIVCTTEGVSYTSSSEANATVDTNGLVTGVAKGTATIAVTKPGYITALVSISVTEKVVEGEIRLEAESGKVGEADIGTDTAVVIRSTSTGETCTAQWGEGAILTLSKAGVTAGKYTLSFVGRAGGQYGTANIEDLSAVIEIKVNGEAVTVPAIAVSGRTFTNYVIGDVEIAAGDLVVEIKGLSANTAPNIDFVKLLPAA